MRHIFIINPEAGKGRTLACMPEIQRLFAQSGEEYMIEITKGPGHATELARKYSAEGECRIYSIGGDGTLNEVLNGMVGSDCSLGIIPGGSGNDFIRSIYDYQKVENIIERTLQGTDRYVDLGKVNGRYFINIASVGIDAEVVYNAREIKKTPFISGHMAYILGIFTTVFKYKSRNMQIQVDDKLMNKSTLLIAVANGIYYGGGMMVAPEAQLEDGFFDICHISEVSRAKILRLFPTLTRGEHGEIEQVSFLRGKKVALNCEWEFSLNIDGEILRTKKAEFEIIPKGVKIIIPV
jgi:diacylglycerol kinase (ATP)